MQPMVPLLHFSSTVACHEDIKTINISKENGMIFVKD